MSAMAVRFLAQDRAPDQRVAALVVSTTVGKRVGRGLTSRRGPRTPIPARPGKRLTAYALVDNGWPSIALTP